MSTRCLIGYEAPTGTVRAIYCHHDGYINRGVGETLVSHFTDEAKIKVLIDGGNISALGERIDRAEGDARKASIYEGYTFFYARDGGEKIGDNAAVDYDSIDNYAATEGGEWSYIYCYHNGEWCYYDKKDDKRAWKSVSENMNEGDDE